MKKTETRSWWVCPTAAGDAVSCRWHFLCRPLRHGAVPSPSSCPAAHLPDRLPGLQYGCHPTRRFRFVPARPSRLRPSVRTTRRGGTDTDGGSVEAGRASAWALAAPSCLGGLHGRQRRRVVLSPRSAAGSRCRPLVILALHTLGDRSKALISSLRTPWVNMSLSKHSRMLRRLRLSTSRQPLTKRLDVSETAVQRALVST